MAAYILRRLLLMIPTLWAILTINFFIVQAAPGGPVEQAMAEAMGLEARATDRIANTNTREASSGTSQAVNESRYRGAQGLDPEVIAEIEKRYGFDKPLWERYLILLRDFSTFNFGDSLFKADSVIGLIVEAMPESIALGLPSLIILYLVSIPLGIRKAVHAGSSFDRTSSIVLSLAYAIPGFLFAILLIILFAGGTYFEWFPLRGLTSPDWENMTLTEKAGDLIWHLVLPVTANVIGGFATLAMLTRNAFLDEIGKQYVLTARAKGLQPGQVLYRHVFRNAMLIVISGFPAAFIGIFFTGSLLIEVIFSIEGMGLLSYEAVIQRDYPVVFGTLYIFTLIGLLASLLTDLTYTWIDPRIDFEKR